MAIDKKKLAAFAGHKAKEAPAGDAPHKAEMKSLKKGDVIHVAGKDVKITGRKDFHNAAGHLNGDEHHFAANELYRHVEALKSAGQPVSPAVVHQMKEHSAMAAAHRDAGATPHLAQPKLKEKHAQSLQTGKHGGKYYVGPNGEKVYVK